MNLLESIPMDFKSPTRTLPVMSQQSPLSTSPCCIRQTAKSQSDTNNEHGKKSKSNLCSRL